MCVTWRAKQPTATTRNDASRSPRAYRRELNLGHACPGWPYLGHACPRGTMACSIRYVVYRDRFIINWRLIEYDYIYEIIYIIPTAILDSFGLCGLEHHSYSHRFGYTGNPATGWVIGACLQCLPYRHPSVCAAAALDNCTCLRQLTASCPLVV